MGQSPSGESGAIERSPCSRMTLLGSPLCFIISGDQLAYYAFTCSKFAPTSTRMEAWGPVYVVCPQGQERCHTHKRQCLITFKANHGSWKTERLETLES